MLRKLRHISKRSNQSPINHRLRVMNYIIAWMPAWHELSFVHSYRHLRESQVVTRTWRLAAKSMYTHVNKCICIHNIKYI